MKCDNTNKLVKSYGTQYKTSKFLGAIIYVAHKRVHVTLRVVKYEKNEGHFSRRIPVIPGIEALSS